MSSGSLLTKSRECELAGSELMEEAEEEEEENKIGEVMLGLGESIDAGRKSLPERFMLCSIEGGVDDERECILRAEVVGGVEWWRVLKDGGISAAPFESDFSLRLESSNGLLMSAPSLITIFSKYFSSRALRNWVTSSGAEVHGQQRDI